MKFLLDTNIFIPLEPTALSGIEPTSRLAAEFVRLAQRVHEIFIHPALRSDLARDRDRLRADARSLLLGKYQELPSPPDATPALSALFGDPARGSNPWVDLQYLAAIASDAADYLVTEDEGVHRRAKRVGLEQRVLYLSQAVSVLRGLQPEPAEAPPLVELVKAYALPLDDPFWNSLRADYQPDFDAWLKRVRRAHRDAWVIWGPNREIAGACLLKDETGTEFGMHGKVLKLATFKVSESFRGRRYGELLLKAAFGTARAGDYDWIYVTAFPRQAELVETFENFGFEQSAERKGDELVLRKRLRPNEADRGLTALEFHRLFGPHLVKADGVRSFIIPIQPRYHGLLFPDADPQLSLAGGAHPFGNAIRKAYLCHASTRKIQPGSILLFYRSERERGVRVVGVAEQTLVSSNAAEIARFVGTRTVYPLREIESLARRTVLAILFRQARLITPPVLLTSLREAGVLNGPPQSITEVPERAMGFVASLVESPGVVRAPS